MAALLICLSTARTAQATCGDYLMGHGDRQHDAGRGVSSDPAEFGQALQGDQALLGDHPRRAPRRCHGPSCGQGSSNRVTDAVPVDLNRSSAGGFACLTMSELGWPPVLERLRIDSDKATLFLPQALLRPPESLS